MSPYSLLLAAFLVGLLIFDYSRFGKRSSRIFLFEIVVFGIGSLFVMIPSLTQRLADLVGVGRGVDFVIYPLLIWLVREAINVRYSQWQEQQRFTELVRAQALQNPRILTQ